MSNSVFASAATLAYRYASIHNSRRSAVRALCACALLSLFFVFNLTQRASEGYPLEIPPSLALRPGVSVTEDVFIPSRVQPLSAAAQHSINARPNILLPLTDDQRWDSYNASGNEKIILAKHQQTIREPRFRLAANDSSEQTAENRPKIPDAPPKAPRTDIQISGIYPHLTTYGVYSQNGAHYKGGHNECGIGAIVPWAGKLWMVNYAPHQPKGSEHKLYSLDADLSRPLTVHPESVGGTPAGRMIHKESNQLLIGHYLIDLQGKVRVISPNDMPIRVTAIARHLTDPKHKVFYVDMEGSIWEANVHTLAVKRRFKKPVPGWHGKGGYTSQGRLVVSNNGELHVGNYRDVLVGGKAKTEEECGVLAEFDGDRWKIVERRQFTEVSGPSGISGGSDGNDPIWAIGWDRRSLRLKLLEDGRWHTFLLPKAAYCNDASHGWYTEWPRIREITGGRWMMDMHGMFFDFPRTLSSKNSAGLKPIGSHLRYVPDFCQWNGKLVLATDETSIQGNKLAGQPQSNLWFGSYEDLKSWGPASGYGGPWIEDRVIANTPSDPFLVAGFDRRVLHLVTGRKRPIARKAARATDQQSITSKLDNNSQPVAFTLQVDKQGDALWTDLETVHVPADGYVAHLLPENLDAVWLRLMADRDCVATAFLHQTTCRFADGNGPKNKALFAGLANAGDNNALGAVIYAAKRNRNLRVITGDGRYFDFTKADFEFQADEPDEKLKTLLHVEPEFTVDEASVILNHRGQTLRLPKGNAAFDRPFASGWPRALREVESERQLANIHGTFYEVPLITNAAPPAWNLMRPVSSHSKQITDFCSWNGLLILSGVRADAPNDGHVFADADHSIALWFGGIDDLWRLGKPIGQGGPWLDSEVKAFVPSAPYLMRGYDKKSAELSHRSSEQVTITLQVDIDGTGLWVDYRSFKLEPGRVVTHRFPTGFSACWVRAVSDRDTKATVTLTYQ